MRLVPTGIAFAALAGLGLSGCSSTGGATAPLNAAAERRGPISFAFVNIAAGSGPVQIVMADGEVLNGQFRDVTFTGRPLPPPPGFAASSLLVGYGPVQFVASGPKTQMFCRGRRTLGGNGSGQCQTADGALWSISW